MPSASGRAGSNQKRTVMPLKKLKSGVGFEAHEAGIP
jgi:hypothetical protein